MANNNPIKLKDTGEYPEFVIPREFAGKVLVITTNTKLLKDKWELDLLHSLSLKGKPIDFDPQPDIVSQEIGICKELDSNKFALISIATRINNGDTGKPAKVKYSLKIEAGDEIIDEEFTITSTEKNPVAFYTKITFKVAP